MALVSRRFFLSRSKMTDCLTDLAANRDSTARSLYIPARLPQTETEQLLVKAASPHNLPNAEIIKIVADSKTGAILLWGSAPKYLVLPPFPIHEKGISDGFTVNPLITLLRHDFRFALILVRLGAYAVGVCQGEKLVSSKVGTGLVHGRHKKGGSSQQRFQRHREKQIESFLNRVGYHVQEQFDAQAGHWDYLVYGGARTTILALQKRCPFLRQFDDRTLAPLLDIPDPRQAVLETAIGRVWSSGVIQWQESEVA